MKKKISNAWEYLVGNFRYFAYNKPRLKWLIRNHIQEQFKLRLKVMKKECYTNGSCGSCGCVTPKLQFAYKSCEGNCYPKLMNRYHWFMFKNGSIKYKDEAGIWKFKKVENTTYLFLNARIKKRMYGKIF
jgi:hypothetical protein